MLAKIEPTATQKEGAKRSHNYLRDILCTGQMGLRITGHYLSGSYARDTAIRPLDDVDVIFMIDPAKWPNSLEMLISGRPSPDAVLTSFASAIRYRYPVSSVYGQRRSVRLELNHLDIDVVPAINADNQGNTIWIPDRDADRWIKSSPKKHSENAANVNKNQNGLFKPIVKLLKYWNGNLPSTANLKSFAIETIAVHLFTNVEIGSLEEGLLLFFDFLAGLGRKARKYRWDNSYGMAINWWECSVPDAAGTGSNTVAGVDDARRTKFIEGAIRSRDKLLDAQQATLTETACRRVGEALRI